MGILDGIVGGSDAGSQGSVVEQQFNQQAIDELARQFNITQENVDPFISAGTDALGDVIEGTSASGLDARLAEIFNTDIFGSLTEERTRAVQNQLSSGGLTRSGGALLEAARVPTDIGLAIEQLLTSRSTNLAGSGQNAAIGLGSIGAQNATSIANLLSASGVAGSSGLVTDAQADAASSQNLLNTAATVASAFILFSDPSLKENIEEIGAINDLTLYQWDWVEAAKGSIIKDSMAIGFMADEVKEKYPRFVGEYGGFMVLNYLGLLNNLENLNKEAA